MGWLSEIGAGLTGGLIDIAKSKYQSDLNQRSAREAAEKNRDISVEMFNMQKASDLEQWERQKEYNAEIWEQEKAYNKELWERDTAYNSPAAQMARMREAGLNPRLMYSQGTVGNVTSPSAPGYDVAEVDRPEYDVPKMDTTRIDIPNGLMSWMQVKQAGLTNENLAAQNALIRQNVAYEKEQARSLKRENDYFEESGGSRWDPSLFRSMQRYGKGAGKFYSDLGESMMVPLFQMMNQFFGKLRDYHYPSWDGKSIGR